MHAKHPSVPIKLAPARILLLSLFNGISVSVIAGKLKRSVLLLR